MAAQGEVGPQEGVGAAGVLIVMLPLPPNGVALSDGAAASLVRTAQVVGSLRLLEMGVAMKARKTAKVAHSTPATMMLATNALMLIAPPILASAYPSGREAICAKVPRHCAAHDGGCVQAPPSRFRHGSWVPRVDQK